MEERGHDQEIETDRWTLAMWKSGRNGRPIDGEMQMLPISPTNPSLMAGNKTSHDARRYPKCTRFVVEE